MSDSRSRPALTDDAARRLKLDLLEELLGGGQKLRLPADARFTAHLTDCRPAV